MRRERWSSKPHPIISDRVSTPSFQNKTTGLVLQNLGSARIESLGAPPAALRTLDAEQHLFIPSGHLLGARTFVGRVRRPVFSPESNGQ